GRPTARWTRLRRPRRRRCTRRTPATACRPCPSSPNRSTAATGSSATRRSWSLCGRSARPTGSPRTRPTRSSGTSSAPTAPRYQEPGERVVQGQRMMQAASDIFLGWTAGAQADRHLYWRQLRDMKGSAVVEAMIPTGLAFYAQICGWTLARAHARSGDPVALARYLGDGDPFDRSITDFSARYADQNEQDFRDFVQA